MIWSGRPARGYGVVTDGAGAKGGVCGLRSQCQCRAIMTTFLDGLVEATSDITGTAFTVRDGQTVPTTDDVGYDQAVKIEATWLYTDLMDSSGLVALSPRETVGKVIRLFLDVSVRIMGHNGGQIRSFDGDRVMAIYHGTGRQDAAVRSAMQIKWACNTLLQPAIQRQYKSIREGGWKIRPASGAASGTALIVRGGVRRKDNDLVSVGVAPNLAAKLSDHRCETETRHVRVDAGTYNGLSDRGRLSSGTNMWKGPHTLTMGGRDCCRVG